MSPTLALRAMLLGLALTLAACANPPPPDAAALDLTPPPRKPYDAKTQLESGRRS